MLCAGGLALLTAVGGQRFAWARYGWPGLFFLLRFFSLFAMIQNLAVWAVDVWESVTDRKSCNIYCSRSSCLASVLSNGCAAAARFLTQLGAGFFLLWLFPPPSCCSYTNTGKALWRTRSTAITLSWRSLASSP